MSGSVVEIYICHSADSVVLEEWHVSQQKVKTGVCHGECYGLTARHVKGQFKCYVYPAKWNRVDGTTPKGSCIVLTRVRG